MAGLFLGGTPTIATGAAPVIVFLGDSLTAGYGLSEAGAYPALIEEKIADAGLEGTVVNAGLSGETTAGGARRVNWVLRNDVDILVVALGANDGLRGIDPEDSKRNLLRIVEVARERRPDIRILLAGMQAPPNMGRTYTDAFASIFPAVAERAGVELIPFLLEGVGGDPAMNLPDGIHPNQAGHARITETVWEHLKGVLGER